MTPALGQGLTPPQRQLYERYDELIREAARREKAALVDLRDSQLAPFLPATMLAEDGIHLTASGQEWLAARLYSHLVQRCS
jgi:lysophospholipase L1-like esterase